ncbi:MAG: hypothetical protein WAZ21_01190 [Candidatus Saccharimonadales bacterium]
MLLIGSRLIGTPIMGLQTGTALARTAKAIIDPRNLTIVAYELSGPLLDRQPSLLRIVDIRELSDIGMIVDSSDEFITPDEVIKIQSVYDLHFDLIGLTVIDDKKHKLGKVAAYTIEATSFVIEQLNVKRPLLRSFGDTELLIHRSQIIEINDTTIIVRSAQNDAHEPVTQAIRSYSNPFRGNSPQPEATTTHQS